MSEIFSQEKTCRTCLGNLNVNSISLFEDVFIQDKVIISIKDVLNSSCPIEITPNDGLPKAICLDCMQKVKQIYLFRIQCESSDKLLRKCLVKSKPITDYSVLNVNKTENHEIVEVIVDEVTLNDNASLLIIEDNNTTQNTIEDVNPLELEIDNNCDIKSKPYSCSVCDISFNWKVTYNEHIRKFHKFAINKRKPRSSQHNCNNCKKSFKLLIDLEEHKLLCVLGSKEDSMIFQKNNNILSENKSENLKDHNSINDLTYCCSTCNKSFSNETNLEKHTRKQHMQPHICKVCHKTFLNRRKLRLHETCHTAESDKKYQCKYCIKKFNQIHHLENHERIHTGQKPYLCNECGKGFRQQYALTLHMRIHSGDKPYICQECGKAFNRKQGLDSHLLCHNGKRNKDDVDDRVYVCTECGIRTTRLRTLVKHMWQVHKRSEDPNIIRQMEQESIHKQRDDTVTKGVLYACNVCQVTFKSNLSLKQHMKVHAFQHICGVCSRAFMLPSQLEAHARFHTGTARLHPCTYVGCTRSFNRPEHARAHYMRAHTTERPFQCEVCMKGFCQSGDLKVHMRYHTGERPYNCTFCDKSFAASSALKGHMRRHTGERPYCCAICQNGYYTSTELNLHMKSHTSKSMEITTDLIQNKDVDKVNTE